MKKFVDINADIGESFGNYKLGFDEEIIKNITSANIATGFHAGDPNWMNKTIELSLENDVAIGAHPSYQDLIGFGRRDMNLTSLEIENIIKYQVGSIIGFIGLDNLQHVKPHGALYNNAVNDKSIAQAIIKSINSISSELIHVVLAGSLWEELADEANVKYIRETFADREFMSDGTLAPRSLEGSVIENIDLIVDRTLNMIENGKVKSFQGDEIEIKFDSICVHGDTKGAIEISKKIHDKLKTNDIEIKSMFEILNANL
jgi:UPF0271 protein|tara:strand:- start:16542 stop:17318 length:777 start_codon:yes stop_codon:yes gene_type:complete